MSAVRSIRARVIRRGAGRRAVASCFTAMVLAPRAPLAVCGDGMKKPNGKAGAATPSEFASDVIEAYNAAIARKPSRREFGWEVRKVAYGLVALRHASDYFFEKVQDDQDITRLPSSALLDAAAILDALTSGQDHPIWRHIDGLKSYAYRPGRAPKAKTERLRRSIVGGLVLALQEAGKLSARKAAGIIISEIQKIQSADISFTSDQLRKWARDNDAREHAKRFIQTARSNPYKKSLSERIMDAGHSEIYRYWSAPVSR